jgi:hypothetical protein
VAKRGDQTVKRKIPWLFLSCFMVLTLTIWSHGCTTPKGGEGEEEEEEEEEDNGDEGEGAEPGDWLPSRSPDGNKIAFDSGRDGNTEIYVMNADGTGQTGLTNNPS